MASGEIKHKGLFLCIELLICSSASSDLNFPLLLVISSSSAGEILCTFPKTTLFIKCKLNKHVCVHLPAALHTNKHLVLSFSSEGTGSMDEDGGREGKEEENLKYLCKRVLHTVCLEMDE